MNIVVTGGRAYKDVLKFDSILNQFRINTIFVGDCPTGADLFARTYARMKDIHFITFNADWDKHGKAAGPIRNKQMLEAAGKDTLVIAFPGGRGTANTVNTAKELGMMVLQVV